jgi:DNA-directed RNA polymerase
MPAISWIPGEATIVAIAEAVKALAEMGKAAIEAASPEQREATGRFWAEATKPWTAVAEAFNKLLGVDKEPS